jgi:uncharacterized membrane protein
MQIEIDFSIFLPNMNVVRQYQEILHPGSFELFKLSQKLDEKPQLLL